MWIGLTWVNLIAFLHILSNGLVMATKNKKCHDLGNENHSSCEDNKAKRKEMEVVCFQNPDLCQNTTYEGRQPHHRTSGKSAAAGNKVLVSDRLFDS